MTNSLKQLRVLLKSSNIDAYLVQNNTNIRYLTGFPANESWLLVGPGRVVYITDFRYILEARKGLKRVAVVQYTGSIYDTLYNLVKHAKIKRLGFDERHLTYAQFKKLKHLCPKGIHLVAVNNLVEQLRAVKNRSEIVLIKKALRIHRQAHNYLKRIIKPGISEQNVFSKLEHFVKSAGAGFSFDPIVASGPNSCYPHAVVTKRKIRSNEPVLIDMGIDVEGYKSDLTRMFFLGKIPPLVKEVNDQVYCAQRKAIKHIKAGISVAEVDYEARNYLAKKGLEKYFGHALGHGVGLDIHEHPRLAQSDKTILREGMIITVEPAVYIPGRFGIRIEDMVLVTKKGCTILSDHIH